MESTVSSHAVVWKTPFHNNGIFSLLYNSFSWKQIQMNGAPYKLAVARANSRYKDTSKPTFWAT